MFLPWKDDNPARRTAWITLGLIAANVVVFGWEIWAGPQPVFERYGLVPARLAAGTGFGTLVTSVFLHAGALHLASNVLRDSAEHLTRIASSGRDDASRGVGAPDPTPA